MPAAARVGDRHRCNKTDPAPHLGGVVLPPGARTVFVGKDPAARAGDRAYCEGDAHDEILTGEPTVLVAGRPAARLGDATDGGHVTSGDATVQIGPHPLAAALRRAARDGDPFCDKHQRVRLAEPDEP